VKKSVGHAPPKPHKDTDNMENIYFLTGLLLFFALLLSWGFRHLPSERWQIMACVPLTKDKRGVWKGLNLTYYGLFSALAYGLGISLLFILLGSAGVPFAGTVIITIVVLACCVPASSIIARFVERKPFTFSVGGASFVGILIAPWVILCTDRVANHIMNVTIPLYPTLAALSIAYAVGEGAGRLACISYGCCYGASLSESGPFLKRIFDRHHFVFTGTTKKIAYASNLDGVKVIPIQAVTSIIYILVAMVGIVLYLRQFFFPSFLIPLVATQCWRVVSEFLRADYRGGGFISAYQIMAILSIAYASGLTFILPSTGPVSVDIIKGISSLWNPVVILTLEVIVIAIFLYTGRSDMTASSITFHIHDERL